MKKTLEQLMDSYKSRPYQPKDIIRVKNLPDTAVQIISISKDGEYTCIDYHRGGNEIIIDKEQIIGYNEVYIGANPFKFNSKLQELPSTVGSIIHMLKNKDDNPNIHELNFDPTVIVNGEIKHYQRGYVWNLEQKQNLIDSIYHGIDCGKIVLRENNVDKIYSEGSGYFYDVVDGKQRLSTIFDFVNDGFPDSNGVYYSQFSVIAKRSFSSLNRIKLTKLVDATDKEVLEQFLITNFAGIPQSNEHIQYVKSLYEKS